MAGRCAGTAGTRTCRRRSEPGARRGLGSTSLEGLPELGGCAPSLGAASLLVADQLRTLLAEDRTDERRSCTHPSDTAPGRRPWSAWGLVAGFPRFFPVRIDDSHHTPYNEEIR